MGRHVQTVFYVAPCVLITLFYLSLAPIVLCPFLQPSLFVALPTFCGRVNCAVELLFRSGSLSLLRFVALPSVLFLFFSLTDFRICTRSFMWNTKCLVHRSD